MLLCPREARDYSRAARPPTHKHTSPPPRLPVQSQPCPTRWGATLGREGPGDEADEDLAEAAHGRVERGVLDHDVDPDALVDWANGDLMASGLASPGERVVVVFGAPIGVSGSTNTIRVHVIS